jgi:NAD(P)H-dependent FMN reductase
VNTPTRILGIAGSLRRSSYNRSALRAAVQLAPEFSTIAIFKLDGIPGFSERGSYRSLTRPFKQQAFAKINSLPLLNNALMMVKHSCYVNVSF